MPADAEELHAAAGILMEVPASKVLGFQMLVEALTGLRGIETLPLQRDAGPNEPGWITPDGKSLCVRRAKNQESVNPFCAIHPALKEVLDALNCWIDENHPGSPWYFPSSLRPGRPVAKGSLAQALRRIQPRLPRKIRGHGLRAFFVTVRRSHGVPDVQIAWEIGHTSGGKTLGDVYGGVPPHWLTGDGPRMSWAPRGARAWSTVAAASAQPENIIKVSFAAGPANPPEEAKGRP
jgi:hypothetical protein